METKKRSIFGLLVSQFFGAFNDNAWKVMLFTIATRPLVNDGSFAASSQLLATLSLVIFLLPMMLVSIPAGALADQMSKRTVILLMKGLEVILMACCCLALYIAPSHLTIPFVFLGLMGAQSALFAPAKYGILPELLPKEELSKGNGLMEMWTMIAIIAGTGIGPILLASDHGGLRSAYTWIGPLWLTGFSIIGFFSSFFVAKVPASRGKQKLTSSLKNAWAEIRGDRILALAVGGSIVYWTCLSLLGQNVLVYAKALVMDLEKGELLQGILPASFGIGIAFGALLSGKFSKDRIEYGFIPLGAIGFTISSLLLGTIVPEMIGTLILMILMGLSCGLLIVPIHAILQMRASNESRGSIIALSGFLDTAGMIGGSLFAAGMAFFGLGLKTMLIASSVIVLLAALWYIKMFPKALVRLCVMILTRTFYRLRIEQFENLPKEGPILLVANHISVIDALFVMASLDRPVRFIVNESYYHKRFIHPIAKLMNAIPVMSTSSPRVLLESLRKATEALEQGEVVCIFPEGQVSHTGKMLPFRRGLEVIARGKSFPIVPIHIANVWGSIFSFERGKFFIKWPKRFSYSVTMTFGKPLPANTSVSDLFKVIQEMEYDAWMARKDDQIPIYRQLISNLRKSPLQTVLADQHEKLTGWQALFKIVALAQKIKAEEKVGILLETGIQSALLNFALTLKGITTVNINPEFVELTIKETQIKTVITSRKYQPPGIEVLYVEDLFRTSAWGNFMAKMIGLFGDMEKIFGQNPLTILFTSGSTGEPKGVVLSHFNVSSNIESLSQVFPYLGKKKTLLTTLPFSHAYGYLLLWLSLNQRFGLIIHPDPFDCKSIGELVKKYDVKLMMCTPKMLEKYLEKILPEQFGSLKCVITGSEKLAIETSDAFEKRFGIRPIEGYGATECSPVIATSTIDVREAGICQIGTVPGSVGQTIPGVLAKIVDPTSFEEKPTGSEGLLIVKGPNVMQGYLNGRENPIRDGWYITNDLAMIDQNGFITILGRYSEDGKSSHPHEHSSLVYR
ncbi:MAG: MFS transporter [Parachlamydiales bacterium]|nr:MFS transporter [Parachlamydiales bacterium]